MSKIKTEIRYEDMAFDLMRVVKGLRMYINKDCTFCIIVDKHDEVLFELRADCNQNVGLLEDAMDV